MNPTLNQDNLVADLNPAQLEAVTHGRGPQLVVAGAGTGKTAVITRRIAHLVSSKQCQAREILALTFTDKAAEEMESRVDLLVPYGFTDTTICTFHAFGDRILREQGVLLGISSDYKVMSKVEQLVFLRENLFELPLVKLRPLADPARHLQLLIKIISRAKDEDVSPADYQNYCRQLKERITEHSDEADRAAWEKQNEIANIFTRYQELLINARLMDFGDLITQTLELLRKNADVLADLRRKFRYILVDEFQDTNAAQFELLRLLAGENPNLTVVGDDDQSIYKFRGAAISNILQFKSFYPSARISVLTRNYRSTQMILDPAYRLVRHNDPQRLEFLHGLDKRLNAETGPGQPVIYRNFNTVSEEADWAAGKIKKHQAHTGNCWSDFAILIRANRQADPFISALNVHSIPYRFTGNSGLYRRSEVKLCLAFLRAVADPTNSLAFHELASSEIYNLPAKDLLYIAAISRRRHISLRQTLENNLSSKNGLLSEEGMQAGRRLIADLEKHTDLSRRLSTGRLLYHFLTESGILAQYTQANNLEADRAIKNLAKFFNVVRRYEHLSKSDRVLHFIQHLEMLEEAGDDPEVSEIEQDLDAVNIMTVHRSKGLEFPVVFIVNMAANLFPSINRNSSLGFPAELAKEELPAEDPHIAEERRLFYVAMTRAKHELNITSARDYGGRRAYKISRFILEALEIPKEQQKAWSASAWEQIKKHAVSTNISQASPQPLPPLAPAEPLTLSFYQIDDFLTCPLKYKYIHILKIPVLPHHAIVYGSALHNAVSEFYRRKICNHPMNDDEIIEIFLRTWVNEGFVSREHEEMRQKAGIAALKKFINDDKLTPIIPKYIEKAFSYTLGHNKIIGRIDRVDILPNNKAIIVDFKSSEVHNQAEADKKARESRQLKIYASAWLRTEGSLPERLELYFLESGLVGRAIPELAMVEEIEELILKVADEIRRQDFPAKHNAWACGYCPYRTLCPGSGK